MRILPAILLTAAASAATTLDGLDALVAEAMKQWQVPGLALAVVKDGAVIHSRGYGWRDVEKKLPVTGQTLFGIGSITKSFTVLTLESLAEEGKFEWDKPVRDYAPDFRLADPVAGEGATTRDLASHRTGLPRHDFMWLGGLTRDQIFARLRYLEPSRDFRAAFQYNNVMYMAAGVVAERAGGATWEELVRRRIFAPLGMDAANFSTVESEKTADWARNYAVSKDAVKEIPSTRAVEAICPAGCINSTLEEMTRYLRLHLGDGALDGRRVFPERGLLRMREPQIHMPAGSVGPERLGPGAYGLGLMMARYRGRPLVFHTGTIGGYHALMAFLPEENIGVMLLQNRVARAVPQAISWWIYDRLLGLEPGGWLEKFVADDKALKEKTEAAKREAEAKRRTGTAPSRGLAEYAGVYTHPGYGTVRITATGEALTLAFGGSPARELTHFHYDIFARDEQRWNFLSGVDGGIERVAVKLEPAADPIEFVKH